MIGIFVPIIVYSPNLIIKKCSIYAAKKPGLTKKPPFERSGFFVNNLFFEQSIDLGLKSRERLSAFKELAIDYK